MTAIRTVLGIRVGVSITDAGYVRIAHDHAGFALDAAAAEALRDAIDEALGVEIDKALGVETIKTEPIVVDPPVSVADRIAAYEAVTRRLDVCGLVVEGELDYLLTGRRP